MLRAIQKRVLTFLAVQFSECTGEFGIVTLCVRLPHDWVPVVLIPADAYILAGVDPNYLFVVHVKAHVACCGERDLKQ